MSNYYEQYTEYVLDRPCVKEFSLHSLLQGVKEFLVFIYDIHSITIDQLTMDLI